MKVIERNFTNGAVELEVLSDHDQPIARLKVSPEPRARDDGFDHFEIHYMLRVGSEGPGVTFVGDSKADTTYTLREKP